MYRYERYLTHFESFYRNPETVSVAGKWVDTERLYSTIDDVVHREEP